VESLAPKPSSPKAGWQSNYSSSEKAYYKALCRFIDRPFFGLTKKDGKTPYHTNGEHDPCADSFYNKTTGREQRRQRQFSHEDVVQHFQSDPTHPIVPTGHWSFLVNSYKSTVHLHAIDIDFDTDVHGENTLSDAMEMGATVALDLFQGIPVFI